MGARGPAHRARRQGELGIGQRRNGFHLPVDHPLEGGHQQAVFAPGDGVDRAGGQVRAGGDVLQPGGLIALRGRFQIIVLL